MLTMDGDYNTVTTYLDLQVPIKPKVSISFEKAGQLVQETEQIGRAHV